MQVVWLTCLGLLLTVYVAMRNLEIAPRMKTDPRVDGPVFFIYALITGAAMWTLAGWLLHWPLGFLAGLGWPGLVVLVILGALIGFFALPDIALGGLLATTLVVPSSTLVNWWVAPAAAGCTAHWLFNRHRHGAWSAYAFDRAVRRNALAGFVHQVVAPTVGDRLRHAAALAVFTLPVFVALTPAALHAPTRPGWPGICALILVTANLWSWDWCLHAILREDRALYRLGASLGVVGAVLLAIGPWGPPLARLLAAAPAGTPIVLAVVPALRWVLIRRARTPSGRRNGLLRIAAIPTGLITKLVTPAVLLAVEYPRHHLLPGSLLVLGTVTLLNLLGAPVASNTMQLAYRLRWLPRLEERALDQIVGHWVFDQFVASSGPRSYRFVQLLAMQYAKTGEPVLRRTAELALDLVQREVLPYQSHDRRTATVQDDHDKVAAQWAALTDPATA
ncbi:hypothetical protein [Actinoallomurus sp. NPDC050550]|uniref:hypothetical protein n=1 Tax=Actinoallomurus sp. NPDC050550 TaxID=3154937 RepID=UPI0034082796